MVQMPNRNYFTLEENKVFAVYHICSMYLLSTARNFLKTMKFSDESIAAPQ